jgi:hypothetical protein
MRSSTVKRGRACEARGRASGSPKAKRRYKGDGWTWSRRETHHRAAFVKTCHVTSPVSGRMRRG